MNNISIPDIKNEFAFRCSTCLSDKIININRPPIVCSTCGTINSYINIELSEASVSKSRNINLDFSRFNNPFEREYKRQNKTEIVDPKKYKRKELKRSPTGVDALDHVTGGGLSEGFVCMIAGPPGCGKSTLCTEAISNIEDRGMHYGPGGAYGSSEEDIDAILETAERIAKANFKIVREKSVRKLIEALDSTGAHTYVIDSLMECYDEFLDNNIPGSPSQINSCISLIYDRAHSEGIYKGLKKRTILIIAHGTKGGDMAGPLKALHGVDGAAIMEHVDPTGDEESKRLPWEPSRDQTRPTGYVSIRVFRKMRKTSNNRIAYLQMENEFLSDGTKNPVGGKLYMVDGPEWESNTIKTNHVMKE